jgi:hypothetical protein
VWTATHTWWIVDLVDGLKRLPVMAGENKEAAGVCAYLPHVRKYSANHSRARRHIPSGSTWSVSASMKWLNLLATLAYA